MVITLHYSLSYVAIIYCNSFSVGNRVGEADANIFSFLFFKFDALKTNDCFKRLKRLDTHFKIFFNIFDKNPGLTAIFIKNYNHGCWFSNVCKIFEFFTLKYPNDICKNIYIITTSQDLTQKIFNDGNKIYQKPRCASLLRLQPLQSNS